MPGLLHPVVWTAQTLYFCPFLPLTWSEAGRKVAQGAAIGCLQPDQSLGTRSVIGQPPGVNSEIQPNIRRDCSVRRRPGGRNRQEDPDRRPWTSTAAASGRGRVSRVDADAGTWAPLALRSDGGLVGRAAAAPSPHAKAGARHLAAASWRQTAAHRHWPVGLSPPLPPPPPRAWHVCPRAGASAPRRRR